MTVTGEGRSVVCGGRAGSYDAECRDGLLRVRHVGPVTRGIWYEAAAAIDAAHGRSALVALVDLRPALLLLDLDALAGAVSAVPYSALSRPSLPGAVIVSEAVAEPMRRYCWRLAETGVLRVPFTDAARAEAWALRRLAWERARPLASAVQG